MLKPILVLVAVVVTVVGIVCGSALLWIHTDHFRLWLQSTLNAKIPGSVTIEHHRLWVLKPRVELEGVTLSDGRGDPVAGLKHLAVELAWRPLWRREVYLRTVLVESPWADLILDNETGLNLLDALVPPGRKETAAPAPAETTGLPVAVVLKSFQLTDGRLSFTPADRRLDVQAAGIDLSASGDLASRQASLKMAIADLRFTSPNIHPPQARINVDARLDGERLNLTAVEVAGGGTSLHLAGTADRLTTLPTVDGRLAIETQLSEIKTLFNFGSMLPEN